MSEPMRIEGVSRCLEGDSCKVRDDDDCAGRCDPSVHSCITCGGAMHAICGQAAPGEDEGYGSKRLCSRCYKGNSVPATGEICVSDGSSTSAEASPSHLLPAQGSGGNYPAPKPAAKGRKPSVVNNFVEVLMDVKGRKLAKEKCCPSSQFKVFNVSRSKAHMMGCSSFARKFPAALEELVRNASGDGAAEDLRRRRTSALVNAEAVLGPKPNQPVISSLPEKQGGPMLPHIAVTSVERRDKLHGLFSDGIIVEGLPFCHGGLPGFKPFWKEAFHGTWEPPSAHFVTGHLGIVFNGTKQEVLAVLRTPPSLGVAIDGFSDVNSKSVFNFMAGGPLPFVFETFRLNGERESAVNLDKIVAGVVANLNRESENRVIGFVSDSPRVMVLARKLICGEQEGGSACTKFAYGCSCHGLSNHVKDTCKVAFVRWTLKCSCKVVQLFRNTHAASHLIAEARSALPGNVRSLKSFSFTRWNGVDELFGSCGENKTAITHVLSAQRLLAKSQSRLDFAKGTKASTVASFALEGEYWQRVWKLSPYFCLANMCVAHLESDTAPLSDVPLCYALLYESLGEFLLPHHVVVECKKSLAMRFSTISSDVHALVAYLDPAIPFSRLSKLGPLYSTRPLNFCASKAFRDVCSFLELSEDDTGAAVAEFDLVMANMHPNFSGRRGARGSDTSHPLIFWSIEGHVIAPQIAPIAKSVFTLFASSAGPERSFKARSRVHSKTRNRLSNANSDMQSSVVFNSKQQERVYSALSKSRDSRLFRALVCGSQSDAGKKLKELLSERLHRGDTVVNQRCTATSPANMSANETRDEVTVVDEGAASSEPVDVEKDAEDELKSDLELEDMLNNVQRGIDDVIDELLGADDV